MNLDGGWMVQEVIKAIETPLSAMRLHTPTLEDGYLAIVGER